MSTIELKEKLKSLRHEVNDLHPVLDSLFRKMTTISAVDYNQGPNEKGADFVLTKPNTELGGTDYIGVIVKVGKISFSDRPVKEQIEQCKLRRVVESGKKEIHLDEIWVICNDAISNNAQERFLQEYNGQKIKFVGIDSLTTLVDKYMPGWFGDIDIRDADFLVRERENAIKQETVTSLLTETQADLYLPQRVALQEVDEYGQYSTSKAVDIYSVIEENSVVFLEAPMGGGKSKLMLNIIKHYCDSVVYATKKIMPFYKSCKDFLNPDFDVESYLDEIINSNHLNNDPDRRYLLIFDGLDEVERSSDFLSKKVVEALDFANQHDNVKILMTSRVIKDKDIEVSLKTRSLRVELEPLKMASILKFIDQISISTNIQGRLVEDLKKSSLFRELPKTPISAILLATILRDNVDELPSSITELYQQYTELSLGRWDMKKSMIHQKEFESGRIILSNIARYFMENELATISRDDALNFFQEYLGQRNLDIVPEDLMEKIINRSGVVFHDDRENTFGFKHRSFLQFFYASYLNSKSTITLDSLAFHPYWTTSYFFLFGLKKDCPELLDQLMSLSPPTDNEYSEEGFRYSRLTNFGTFLLAAYNSPYSKIQEGIEFIFSEAAQLYIDINEKPQNFTLSKLPSLQLLGLIRYILNDQYSYKFFTEGIEKSLLQLDAETDIEMYKYLFLDCANTDLGGDEVFMSLNDKQAENLPLPIKAIVSLDSKVKNHKSKVLSKIVKKFKKQNKTSKVFNQELMKIAYTSIDGTVDSPPNRALNPVVKKRGALRAKRKS